MDNEQALKEALECLQDVVSHYRDFWTACETKAGEYVAKADKDNATYWDHQQTVLRRMKDQAERAIPFLAALPAQDAAPVRDERAAFQKAMNDARFFPAELDFAKAKSPSGRDEYANSHLESCWVGWQARAALAQADARDVEKRNPGRYLGDDDFSDLFRFNECCDDPDAGGHDIPRERMRRLEDLGAVRNCGFGRHKTTAFGDFVLETAFLQNPRLPLKTTEEYNRDAAIKAQEGKS